MNEDEAIMRRARPLLEEAVQRQRPDVAVVLSESLAAGDLSVDYERDEAGVLWLVFAVAGRVFCRIDIRNVGLHEVGGELVYLRDPLLDDDVE